MRPNYLKFLELILRSIKSKVEIDVYHSFLLSSIVIAIKFEYLHKWTISNTKRSIVVTIEFKYFRSSLNICNKHQILNLFFIAHLFDLTEIYDSRVSNCIELHKFWHYSTDLGTNSYSRDRIVYWFFYQYLITIHIESIWTTMISVELYEYRRYLMETRSQ